MNNFIYTKKSNQYLVEPSYEHLIFKIPKNISDEQELLSIISKAYGIKNHTLNWDSLNDVLTGSDPLRFEKIKKIIFINEDLPKIIKINTYLNVLAEIKYSWENMLNPRFEKIKSKIDVEIYFPEDIKAHIESVMSSIL